MTWRTPTSGDLSLAATIAITSFAEYSFGRDALDWPIFFSACIPAAIDSYVFRAMRSGRARAAAVVLMIASSGGATAANLMVLSDVQKLVCAGLFVSVLAIVVARVHIIQLEETRAQLAAATENTVTLEQQLDTTAEAYESASRRVQSLMSSLHATQQDREGAIADYERLMSQKDAELSAVRHQLEEARAQQPPSVPDRKKPAAPSGAAPKKKATEHKSDVLRLIRGVLKDNPGAGRPTIASAIREAGYRGGSADIADLLTEARTPRAV